MAGQITHICLANSVCTKEGLDSISTLTPGLRSALESYQPFCRLGAVSPDCPAFIYSTDATGWNSVMHYLRPADFVRYAIPKVAAMSFNTVDAKTCIAWLFGYTSHLVADYTIHPVVAEMVGPYADPKNRPAHRNCETTQDTYAYHQLDEGELVGSDFLAFSELAQCGAMGSLQKLNLVVAALWKTTLRQYSAAEIHQYVRLPAQSLDPDNWFATYLNVMNFATRLGFSYQKYDEIDLTYIEKLKVPDSPDTMHFDQLFEMTRQNIIVAWTALAQSLVKEDATLFTLQNANLDTGKTADGTFLFWA